MTTDYSGRTAEKTINGRKYTSNKYSVEQFIDIELKVQKVIGKALGEGVGAFDIGSGAVNGVALGGAIDALTDNIIEAGGVALYKQILANCYVSRINERGEELQLPCRDLNVAFDGNVGDLKLVVFFVLQHNFADYLSGAFGKFGGVLEQVKARAATDFSRAFSTTSNE